ncbi:hypothetical protein ACSBR2_022234 [Camellia fascicularis]
MDLINSVMNLVVPPASWVMLAVAWPALTFINACEWAYDTFFPDDMEDKVVIITGASSAIGENSIVNKLIAQIGFSIPDITLKKSSGLVVGSGYLSVPVSMA